MRSKRIEDVLWNKVCHSREDSTDEIISVFSSTDKIQKPKFSHYLCFVVSVKTKLFVYKQNEKYSSQQEEMFNLIQSLHNSGLGYRKISHYLNERGIPTHKGNKWGSNNVYSVLKRHKQREKRLDDMQRVYEPEWSKMKVVWERNPE